jgi:hypothetical protein
MIDSPINLIYIASIGRSGTTLFETMLGAHSRVETTGELHLWPHELLQGGVRPCGSGLYVDECPFWTEMRRRVAPLQQPRPQIHAFREAHDAGRTLRLNRLSDFADRPLPPSTARKVDTYGRNNAEIVRTFQDLVEERTGERPEWVVDASKDPYRLLWLARSGYFNLKVIHMVKHPCGFAYSVTDNWIHRDGLLSDLKRLYYTARQSGAWVTRNTLLRLVRRRHMDEDDHMLLRYEDLATHPDDVFRKACALIGIPYEEHAVDHWRKGSRFTIAGNPMRYEDRDIELDDRWKSQLPSSSRWIARSISSVTRDHYNYD